jgi:hypothetical protein
MRQFLGLAALALLAASPAAAQSQPPLNPAQAIAAAASGDVEGVFEFQIGSVGESGFAVYLNSSVDYRDPANLTVELKPGAIAELQTRLGGEPRELLAGKRVRVTGVAKRVPIPKRDGTTYYQTRIDADRGNQIEILR